MKHEAEWRGKERKIAVSDWSAWEYASLHHHPFTTQVSNIWNRILMNLHKKAVIISAWSINSMWNRNNFLFPPQSPSIYESRLICHHFDISSYTLYSHLTFCIVFALFTEILYPLIEKFRNWGQKSWFSSHFTIIAAYLPIYLIHRE